MDTVRYGCVLFDDTSIPRKGLASLAGESPFQIESVGDLDSDVIWVSNLSFQQTFENNLHNSPKIRRENFLRVPLQRLAREIDLNVITKQRESVQVLSEIIHRVMTFAQQSYQFERSDVSLRKTIEKAMVTQEQQDQLSIVNNALEQAFLPFQKCYGNPGQAVDNVQFRYSRTHYANNMLRMPYPEGKFEMYSGVMPQKNIDRGQGSDLYAFLQELANKKPALCKVVVSKVNPDVDELLDFTHGSSALREWMPIQEAMKLAEYSVVNIKNIMIGERYTTAENEGYILPNEGPASDLSLSYGLLAENVWLSIASQTKELKAGKWRDVFSPRAVWLRSWDRISCLEAALAFKRNGIHVSSYGIGCINVCVWPEIFKKATDLALELKLSPPIWILDDIECQAEEREKELKYIMENKEVGERL